MAGKFLYNTERQSDHTNCALLSSQTNSVRFSEYFLPEMEDDSQAGGHAESEMGRFCPRSCECYFLCAKYVSTCTQSKKNNVTDEEKEREE